MVLVAVTSVPSARPLQLEHYYHPIKKFHGEAMGYQDPSGAKRSGTGQPTGTGSHPWAKL